MQERGTVEVGNKAAQSLASQIVMISDKQALLPQQGHEEQRYLRSTVCRCACV